MGSCRTGGAAAAAGARYLWGWQGLPSELRSPHPEAAALAEWLRLMPD